MKTAEELYIEKTDPFIKEEELNKDIVIMLMKQYAKEAIKADRENVAKHAHFYINAKTGKGEFQLYQKNDFSISIDKDSIIKAPNIKLL